MKDRIPFSIDAIRSGMVVLLAITFASGASAQDRDREADFEEDVINAVTLASRKITLGDVVYQVSDKTQIFDAEGRRIFLPELELESMVEYTSRPGARGGPPLLDQLHVREGDYE